MLCFSKQLPFALFVCGIYLQRAGAKEGPPQCPLQKRILCGLTLQRELDRRESIADEIDALLLPSSATILRLEVQWKRLESHG